MRTDVKSSAGPVASTEAATSLGAATHGPAAFVCGDCRTGWHNADLGCWRMRNTLGGMPPCACAICGTGKMSAAGVLPGEGGELATPPRQRSGAPAAACSHEWGEWGSMEPCDPEGQMRQCRACGEGEVRQPPSDLDKRISSARATEARTQQIQAIVREYDDHYRTCAYRPLTASVRSWQCVSTGERR